MAASSGSSSFAPSGPFHFAAPKEFDGKNYFEEFSFKLQAYLSLMNKDYSGARQRVEENLDTTISEEFFYDADRQPTALVDMSSQPQWILVSLCTGPASTFFRNR